MAVYAVNNFAQHAELMMYSVRFAAGGPEAEWLRAAVQKALAVWLLMKPQGLIYRTFDKILSFADLVNRNFHKNY